MTEEKPVVYILRGDDREGIAAHLQQFIANLGSPDMAEMNTTRLDGKAASLNDVRSAALALPFLTERRLVIVEDAIHPYQGRGKEKLREELIALFDSLPGTTALVLVIPDSQKYQRDGPRWETLTENHWLIKWTENTGSRAFIINCALPTDREMVTWIKNKAVELSGSFTPRAAHTLTEYVGNDTQRAAQEIIKLLTYANFSRPVEDDDVRLLTTRDHQTDIFTLVDSIGNRDGKQDLEMLHLLLDESDPLQLFGMVIRQFRLMLQAREIIDEGGNESDVAKKLHQHQFVAKKVSVQCQQFEMPALKNIYQHLLKIDLDMKTGGMPGDIALYILITQLSN